MLLLRVRELSALGRLFATVPGFTMQVKWDASIRATERVSLYLGNGDMGS